VYNRFERADHRLSKRQLIIKGALEGLLSGSPSVRAGLLKKDTSDHGSGRIEDHVKLLGCSFYMVLGVVEHEFAVKPKQNDRLKGEIVIASFETESLQLRSPRRSLKGCTTIPGLASASIYTILPDHQTIRIILSAHSVCIAPFDTRDEWCVSGLCCVGHQRVGSPRRCGQKLILRSQW